MDLSSIEEFLQLVREDPTRTALLLLALILTMAFAAWLTSYFSEKGKRAASGPQTVSIDQITIGRKQTESSLDVIIRNRALAPALVKNVTISGQIPRDDRLASIWPPMETIKLGGEARYFLSPDAERIVGSFMTASNPDYVYPFIGNLKVTPVSSKSSFNIKMDTAINLAPQSLSRVRILIPNLIYIRNAKKDPADAYSRRALVPLDIQSFNDVSVSLETADGQIPRFIYSSNSLQST